MFQPAIKSSPRSCCPAGCRESLIYDTGSLKLADFGLSKSLPVNKHASYDLESKFRLTGETGSYRYMAPEVFRWAACTSGMAFARLHVRPAD